MKGSELPGYAGLVDYAISCGETSISLENKDRDHARELIRQLINNARESIVILCHRLARDVYGSREVTAALVNAYKNNPDLKCTVYLRDYPQITPFLMHLAKHGVLPKTLKKEIELGDILIVDGENGREECDPIRRTAKGIIRNREWGDEALHKLEQAVTMAI